MEKETPEEYVARMEKELNPTGAEVEVSFPEHEKWEKNVAELKKAKGAFDKTQEEKKLKEKIEKVMDGDEKFGKEAQG